MASKISSSRWMEAFRLIVVTCALLLTAFSPLKAVEPVSETALGDRLFREFCEQRTKSLGDACLRDIRDLKDWETKRPEYRRQLFEMLGLDPLPPRTDLKPQVTATSHRAGVRVERVHFQSQPGLYVTGNLYLPDQHVDGERLPAILYLCGHGQVKKDGVSYGNKTHYQRHGAWYARNGYACLVLDSLQLGEIEGIHHGTHRYGMWWWLNRGYTPAGVEAWNCIRALDYLQMRPEVDPSRIGVTGRSGGGAYSWWIAALDDRVQVAVPVAGITDLENHVIDGAVDGHCDCMYFVNTYGWDYPLVAAMVAPRPLVISNTDRDSIFPLEGVVRTHAKVRHIYSLYGKPENLALHITAGPHEDTQELQIHAFRWFNQHLRGTLEPVTIAAEPLFTPEELQVFLGHRLPPDERNTKIHEQFVSASRQVVPTDAGEWKKWRTQWIRQLSERVFGGWPRDFLPLKIVETSQPSSDEMQLARMTFESESPFRLPLVLVGAADLPADAAVELRVLDEAAWEQTKAIVSLCETLQPVDASQAESLRFWRDHSRRTQRWVALFVPRGIGPTAPSATSTSPVQLRRRLYLLGLTYDQLQAWDVRRAIQSLRVWPRTSGRPMVVTASEGTSGATLFASLFEPELERLELTALRPSLEKGPILLNAARFLEMPQALAMAVERQPVVLHQAPASQWPYVEEVARVLELPKDQWTSNDKSP